MKKAKSKNLGYHNPPAKIPQQQEKSRIPASHIVAYTLCALLTIFVVAKYIFGMEISFGNKPTPQSDIFHSQTETKTETTETAKTGPIFGTCTREYNPVCGADGRTYGNACIAEVAKQAHTPWECKILEESQNTSSSGTTDIPDENTLEPNACTTELLPVCADDNKIYPNACMAKMANVEVSGKWKCENSTTENTTSSTGSTNTPATAETKEFSADKYHLYDNARFKYSFAMPNFSYYQGYGAVNGADHTMAVGLNETDIANLENAPVQVYYFSKLPSEPPVGEKITLSNGNIVILVTKDITQPKIQKIADTVRESIKSNM